MHVIASGSKGNASIIYNKDTVILIDNGLSKRRLILGLNEVNKGLDDITAFLLTHDHSDHTYGASFVPLGKRYARKGTILLQPGHELELFNSYIFGSIQVTVLQTSHDAIAPCGFIFKEFDTDETILYMTDTGMIPKKSLKLMKNCVNYFIESNHDVEMLLASDRPDCLKKRILSKVGHLSNIQCGEYLCTLIGPKTRNIMLAHLSEECNTPEAAENTVKNILENEGLLTKNLHISHALQKESKDLC